MAPTRTVFSALTGGIALASVGALLLLSGVVVDSSAATLEQKQSAARDRIESTASDLESGRADLEAAQEKADAAAAKESELSGLISNGAERATELGDRVARSERELGEAKRRLARARKLLRQRLVSMYMSGMPDVVDLALGSDSFADLASRTVYLRSISESDTRMAGRVAQLRSDLADHVAGLGEAKAAVDAHNAELEAARAGISAARAAAESTASRLTSVNEFRQAEIGELKSSIKTWQKQIEREEAATAEEAEQQVEQNLGGPYSIPTYIVMCESGGNYSALNASSGAGGAYQILPSTWEYYGGKGLPHQASKAEQDRIAALIWANDGPGAWVCAG